MFPIAPPAGGGAGRGATSIRNGARCFAALIVTGALTAGAGVRAAGIADTWEGTRWGEPLSGLAAHFGPRATILPRPLDFGDSYAQLVLRGVIVGGIPLIAFFQLDKSTGGLKRIQLERQRHGVNPPAFRAVVGAVEATYGAPDPECRIGSGPTSGYQRGIEHVWRRDGLVIRAIFRDTTIEAFEGCLDPGAGPCGLTGQLVVRISPPQADAASCPAPARRR